MQCLTCTLLAALSGWRRSFGDPDFKEPLHLVTATPDVAQHRLAPGDAFVVLASDGLVRSWEGNGWGAGVLRPRGSSW